MNIKSSRLVLAPCSRRAALRGLGIAALVPFLGNVLAACQAGSSDATATSTTCSGGLCIDLADAANAALTTVGGAMIVDATGDTLIVVRVSDTSVIALSAVCTHEGCIVEYDTTQQDINCPCHGSRFTTAGSVTHGPANQPLAVYTAALAGTTITITGV